MLVRWGKAYTYYSYHSYINKLLFFLSNYSCNCQITTKFVKLDNISHLIKQVRHIYKPLINLKLNKKTVTFSSHSDLRTRPDSNVLLN